MSDIIRLLPDHVANQIAAGEVVQRPASVVKELIENCIDAGATKIELILKDAGRTLIQVIDNGKGISEHDARMCFERHATSKIAQADDLFALTTKGFRGEALASIAAIAHVQLRTKRPSDELGTKIVIEGTEIKNQEADACQIGSNFEVRNLFYNVPARRNFLKSDQVEFKHILDEFERIVLPHPELAFRLVHNEQEIYNLFPSHLRKRIVDVFGKKYNSNLVPVTESTDIARIDGFVVSPELAKKTRGEQLLFVNNRFFKDTYFNHAVSSAFEQLLAPKMHPGYFLFLEVDPQKIDVNVHPTKTEIKFEEDKAIYSIIRSAIRLGLGKYNITPTLDFDNESEFDIPYEMKFQPAVEPEIKVDKNYNPFRINTPQTNSTAKAYSSAISNVGFGQFSQGQSLDEMWNTQEATDEISVSQHQLELEIDSLIKEGPFISKNAFIFCSVPDGLLIIHGRRAYERILYNSMMKQFLIAPLSAQQLLFPMEKTVSKQEALAWQENEKTINRIGFDWALEGDTLSISGIPNVLSESTVLDCVDRILEQLQMGEIDKGEVAHAALSKIAFAGSMNYKNPIDQEALANFVNNLFEQDEHFYSPSGKKIIAQITNSHILQLF
ncbi:MAG TPA: DNA mismatch repair endonuclease MutL [Fluviicola sp.]|nr:DNA mismatch repair endonuclease MutL [Fluviicola sp.]